MKNPTVPQLWCNPKLIDKARIYMTCEPGRATRCINTQTLKVIAEYLGREVRKVNTLKGYANWSECVRGTWHMFRMPLHQKYAFGIDEYDRTGIKFRLPVAAPFEKVEWRGPCVESRGDPPEVVAERKAIMAVRIADGTLVPRSKFRAPQAAAVQARLAAAA